MTDTAQDPQLTLVTWNVERSSIDRFEDQLSALRERSPDIVALQEVGVRTSRRPHRFLREQGFAYTAHSHDFVFGDLGNSSGVAFASRWPFRVLSPDTFDMPARHHALSAEFFTPFGRVEGHTVHVLPGSMDRERKTEMFDGVYERLARDDPADYRFLCGDFNSPKTESDDGEVTVWGSSERHIEAERSVMVGLADYGLADAYRAVNGYGDDAYSWVARNRGNEWPRRFDHVFASEALGATDARYLHQYDDLSDHTPLEVGFAPEGGLLDDADELESEAFTPTTKGNDTAGATDGSGSAGDGPTFDGLTYDEDARVVERETNYRRGRFTVGWDAAVDGEELDDVLDRLTWENLGWRLGLLFGDVSEAQREALYEWCVDQLAGSE